jgi:hypothetical protein
MAGEALLGENGPDIAIEMNFSHRGSAQRFAREPSRGQQASVASNIHEEAATLLHRNRDRQGMRSQSLCENSDGPQPSGCINVRTTLVSKSFSVFVDDKGVLERPTRRRIANTPRLRTLKQPEGCGPSEFHKVSFASPFH